YKKWSDPATWAPGPIPGQGDAIGANVTIVCGEAILLDTSPIALTLLNIRGFLRVLDSPALPKIDLSAAFIVVQGNFSIGTPQQHYRQRIKITLTPNPNNRADYLFTENLPAEPAFPRNLGHKAFAVVGGQVDFHGMPGGSSTPAWTKLTATAQPNDLVITVQDDVSSWPQDAFVVVTSTDYFPDQAEVVGIIDVVALPSGGSKIFLEKPLRLMHFGDPKGVPDGYGGFVDQRAEVALLNRSIAITGTDEPAPYHREGGHFMIFMSNTPQFIEGVEFAQMGQQGKLGRYNIHFHVCGDDAGRSVVRKNVMHDSKQVREGWWWGAGERGVGWWGAGERGVGAEGESGAICGDDQGCSVVRKNVMHDSKQRCVVVHTIFNLTVEENVAYHTRGHCFMVEEGGEGRDRHSLSALCPLRFAPCIPHTPPHQRCVVVHTTFNLTVEENVAYHTRGHCFMVEEGGETDNTFLRNLGIWTRAGAVNLDDSRCDESGQEQVRRIWTRAGAMNLDKSRCDESGQEQVRRIWTRAGATNLDKSRCDESGQEQVRRIWTRAGAMNLDKSRCDESGQEQVRRIWTRAGATNLDKSRCDESGQEQVRRIWTRAGATNLDPTQTEERDENRLLSPHQPGTLLSCPSSPLLSLHLFPLSPPPPPITGTSRVSTKTEEMDDAPSTFSPTRHTPFCPSFPLLPVFPISHPSPATVEVLIPLSAADPTKADDNPATFSCARDLYLLPSSPPPTTPCSPSPPLSTGEVLIPLSAADPTKTEETDDNPSTFSFTQCLPYSLSSLSFPSINPSPLPPQQWSYWMELRDRVRGFTLSYPGLNATVPANGPFGIYRDNVAHSNRGPGWRTYPKGVRPRQTWSLESPIPQWQWKPSTGTISGLLLYKQSGDGLFVHNSDGLIITNSTFADNRQGLNLLGNTGVKVTDSRFIGVTPNYGNPRMCDSTPQMCGPVTGCDFPLAAGQQGRSQGWSHWKNPIFGIIIDHPTFGFDFARAHAISNCRFHAYDSTCRLAAAIGAGINGAPKDTWATATSVQAVTGTPGTNMLYFPPRNFTFPRKLTAQLLLWCALCHHCPTPPLMCTLPPLPNSSSGVHFATTAQLLLWCALCHHCPTPPLVCTLPPLPNSSSGVHFATTAQLLLWCAHCHHCPTPPLVCTLPPLPNSSGVHFATTAQLLLWCALCHHCPTPPLVCTLPPLPNSSSGVHFATTAQLLLWCALCHHCPTPPLVCTLPPLPNSSSGVHFATTAQLLLWCALCHHCPTPPLVCTLPPLPNSSSGVHFATTAQLLWCALCHHCLSPTLLCCRVTGRVQRHPPPHSLSLLHSPPITTSHPPQKGGDVNRGGEATDLYTLWDKDGSLLNATAGGYLLANNTALLPPTKRFPACQPVPAWNAYACPGTCYRTVMFTYLEPAFAVYENSSVPDTRKRGDFSYLAIRRIEDETVITVDGNLRYLSIRRIEDDTVITVDGNLRSVGNMWTAGQRIFVVPLLANATYEVNIGLPGNNRAFFPSNITVQLRDSNGCGGPVTLRIPAKQSNQWMINEEQDVNWKACAGTSDKAAVQFSFVCFKFKPTLELFFDGTSSKPIVLRASANPVTGCRLPYRCGLVAPGSTWAYDVSGRELHAAVTGAMGFSSPRFNDASWPRGPAIIGYVGWRWVGINTWTPPSGDALPTFYYRRPFRVANSACATGLYVDVIVNDGVLLYLNGVEMLRVNMAPGAVNVSSRALSNQNVWVYTSFFIPLNATAPFSLAEGTNHIAAESHAAIWTTENFFDLKLSAQMDSATCSGVLILQEVCDGLDNNNDGKVDIDPLTDRLLTRPCRNPCGAGIETCIDGAFQNCTAPVHGPEVCNGVGDNCDGIIDNSPSPAAPQLDCANGSLCSKGQRNGVDDYSHHNSPSPTTPQLDCANDSLCNGVDDNCDGLIDNSPSPTAARLDCADGSLCFKGQCLPYGPLTAPVTVINKSAAGWLYYDKGYLPQSYPTWSTNSPLAQPTSSCPFPASFYSPLPLTATCQLTYSRRAQHRLDSTQHRPRPPTSLSQLTSGASAYFFPSSPTLPLCHSPLRPSAPLPCAPLPLSLAPLCPSPLRPSAPLPCAPLPLNRNVPAHLMKEGAAPFGFNSATAAATNLSQLTSLSPLCPSLPPQKRASTSAKGGSSTIRLQLSVPHGHQPVAAHQWRLRLLLPQELCSHRGGGQQHLELLWVAAPPLPASLSYLRLFSLINCFIPPPTTCCCVDPTCLFLKSYALTEEEVSNTWSYCELQSLGPTPPSSTLLHPPPVISSSRALSFVMTLLFSLKGFALTEEQADNTWCSATASVQRDDGAVLLMNGAEFFRSNMPAGPITSASFAATGTWGADKTTFFNSTPFRSIAQFLQPGTNWVGVQLHQSRWSSDALFDLELTRHAMRPCSALEGSPAACVRTPPADTLLLAVRCDAHKLRINWLVPCAIRHAMRPCSALKGSPSACVRTPPADTLLLAVRSAHT
ncbi:unnamed protein product, partial [Closterium sp. Naga37s-1]